MWGTRQVRSRCADGKNNFWPASRIELTVSPESICWMNVSLVAGQFRAVIEGRTIFLQSYDGVEQTKNRNSATIARPARSLFVQPTRAPRHRMWKDSLNSVGWRGFVPRLSSGHRIHEDCQRE